MDKNGLPITYELFRGNTTDYETLLPVLSKLKENYNLKRAIVVADKGLNSGSNKAYNIIKGDGYIFSKSIRGTKSDKEFKSYVLDEDGYRYLGENYKIISRVSRLFFLFLLQNLSYMIKTSLSQVFPATFIQIRSRCNFFHYF